MGSQCISVSMYCYVIVMLFSFEVYFLWVFWVGVLEPPLGRVGHHSILDWGVWCIGCVIYSLLYRTALSAS